jgi:hypothetical protein
VSWVAMGRLRFGAGRLRSERQFEAGIDDDVIIAAWVEVEIATVEPVGAVDWVASRAVGEAESVRRKPRRTLLKLSMKSARDGKCIPFTGAIWL